MGRDLEAKFSEYVRQLCERSVKECGYNPHVFVKMINSHGVLSACRQVIRSRRAPSGFTTLWEKGRLDLTVEAAVLQSPWRELFEREPDVLLKAQKRLRDYHYEEA
jgi:hypothetical protein